MQSEQGKSAGILQVVFGLGRMASRLLCSALCISLASQPANLLRLRPRFVSIIYKQLLIVFYCLFVAMKPLSKI